MIDTWNMSIESHRVDGDTVVMQMRGGGEMTMNGSLIASIEPDEVPHPAPAPVLAEADVPPPLGSPLCDGLVKPAKEIVDPLSARGIVLLSEDRPIVLCAMDWVGVGNSFSFLAGRVRRAPIWMQRIGMEWIHRLCQEPKRLFKRYLIVGVPFAASLLTLALKEEVKKRRHYIDYIGAVLMALATTLMMIALTEADTLSITTIAAAFGVSALLLAALIFYESRVSEPMIPIRLYRSRIVAGGNWVGAANGAISMAIIGFLPVYMRILMGSSTLMSGVAPLCTMLALEMPPRVFSTATRLF